MALKRPRCEKNAKKKPKLSQNRLCIRFTKKESTCIKPGNGFFYRCRASFSRRSAFPEFKYLAVISRLRDVSRTEKGSHSGFEFDSPYPMKDDRCFQISHSHMNGGLA